MKHKYTRQAVVVIHGMGEQRPLDTLYNFVDTGLEPNKQGKRLYYSRPETVTGSFEERRLLAPVAVLTGGKKRPQTEFFEYHWSYKMQGNKLSDLWPLLRRTVLQWPTRVPSGLRGAWWLVWAIALGVGLWLGLGHLVGNVGNAEAKFVRPIAGVLSFGILPSLILFLLRMLPEKITATFVDVVRYLDTSPRSYAVRRDIREGLVDMLKALHDPVHGYDRIVVVAHSLGGYIAYDGISYLWSTMYSKNARQAAPAVFGGLEELEKAASALPDAPYRREKISPVPHDQLAAYQEAQHKAWVGLRNQGNEWRITDLVTAGTPMYFADELLATINGRTFSQRVDAREIVTCPPQSEFVKRNNVNNTAKWFTWTTQVGSTDSEPDGSRHLLHEAAPFAVVRWTNVYFPAKLGFFGDWFGGPLQSLFGTGIADVPLTGNTFGSPGTKPWRNRWVPALAHSFYFKFPGDDADGSAACEIRKGLQLESETWMSEVRPPQRQDAAVPVPTRLTGWRRWQPGASLAPVEAEDPVRADMVNREIELKAADLEP